MKLAVKLTQELVEVINSQIKNELNFSTAIRCSSRNEYYVNVYHGDSSWRAQGIKRAEEISNWISAHYPLYCLPVQSNSAYAWFDIVDYAAGRIMCEAWKCNPDDFLTEVDINGNVVTKVNAQSSEDEFATPVEVTE